MKTIRHSLITSCLAILLLSGYSTHEAGPLPEFTLKGVALHPESLSYAPTGELEHPALIKMEGHTKNPLARYYLYYAPHKHVGIGMVYSDNMEGPWKEYQGNPVLEGPAAPDIRWIKEKGGGLWAMTFPAEDRIFEQADRKLADWRKGQPDIVEMKATQDALAAEALSVLERSYSQLKASRKAGKKPED